MIAASAPTKPPKLESAAARLGVGVLVLLSLYIGYQYWIGQGDEQLAYVTVAAEIIAFSGLVLVRWKWREDRGWACVGLALTLLAAAWCGLTMYEKIAADSRQSAIEAAQATLPYRMAAREFETASTALTAKLAESPPAGAGPQTIAAWEASQAASVTRLTEARNAAERRLEAATPPIVIDVFAIVRGIGVELIKLLGFAAFGLLAPMEVPRETQARAPRQSFWRKALAWLSVGAMGLGFAGPAHASEPATLNVAPVSPPDATAHVLTIDAKTRAFSLYDTGQWKPEQIAAEVGVARSTIYRWIAKREAARRKPRAA
jgi:hypothetical protein